MVSDLSPDELYEAVLEEMLERAGFFYFPRYQKEQALREERKERLKNPVTLNDKLESIKALEKTKQRHLDSPETYNRITTKQRIRLVDAIVGAKYKRLTSVLNEDLEELYNCYKNKTYKATLILAGSILEAFLLDWLSEIDGKNYFEEPFMVWDKKSNKFVKKEELNEYIKKINAIKFPDWMETSKKAHFIRQKRNLVHAKLCLREDVGINAETCGKVIEYLLTIVKTRFEEDEDIQAIVKEAEKAG